MSRHHGPGPLRKVKCPVCKRLVSVYVPTTSSTGHEVFRAHMLVGLKQYCDATGRQVQEESS